MCLDAFREILSLSNCLQDIVNCTGLYRMHVLLLVLKCYLSMSDGVNSGNIKNASEVAAFVDPPITSSSALKNMQRTKSAPRNSIVDSSSTANAAALARTASSTKVNLVDTNKLVKSQSIKAKKTTNRMLLSQSQGNMLGVLPLADTIPGLHNQNTGYIIEEICKSGGIKLICWCLIHTCKSIRLLSHDVSEYLL